MWQQVVAFVLISVIGFVLSDKESAYNLCHKRFTGITHDTILDACHDIAFINCWDLYEEANRLNTHVELIGTVKEYPFTVICGPHHKECCQYYYPFCGKYWANKPDYCNAGCH